MEAYIEKTIRNLEKNNMKVFFAESKEQVVPLVKTLLKEGESVSNGGSVTLKETGVMDLLAGGAYQFIDRSKAAPDEIRDYYIKAFGCDSYFCSANAVTEEGELYNVDGNSNRVACIVYGPKQVIMVVGKNKIVKNIDEAIRRVKQTAAPANTVRLNCNTPCSKTGRCISLSDEDPGIAAGCRSQDRVCCNYVVSSRQRHKDRIKVILVNEDLGY